MNLTEPSFNFIRCAFFGNICCICYAILRSINCYVLDFSSFLFFYKIAIKPFEARSKKQILIAHSLDAPVILLYWILHLCTSVDYYVFIGSITSFIFLITNAFVLSFFSQLLVLFRVKEISVWPVFGGRWSAFWLFLQ